MRLKLRLRRKINNKRLKIKKRLNIFISLGNFRLNAIPKSFQKNNSSLVDVAQWTERQPKHGWFDS